MTNTHCDYGVKVGEAISRKYALHVLCLDTIIHYIGAIENTIHAFMHAELMATATQYLLLRSYKGLFNSAFKLRDKRK